MITIIILRHLILQMHQEHWTAMLTIIEAPAIVTFCLCYCFRTFILELKKNPYTERSRWLAKRALCRGSSITRCTWAFVVSLMYIYVFALLILIHTYTYVHVSLYVCVDVYRYVKIACKVGLKATSSENSIEGS